MCLKGDAAPVTGRSTLHVYGIQVASACRSTADMSCHMVSQHNTGRPSNLCQADVQGCQYYLLCRPQKSTRDQQTPVERIPATTSSPTSSGGHFCNCQEVLWQYCGFSSWLQCAAVLHSCVNSYYGNSAVTLQQGHCADVFAALVNCAVIHALTFQRLNLLQLLCGTCSAAHICV